MKKDIFENIVPIYTAEAKDNKHIVTGDLQLNRAIGKAFIIIKISNHYVPVEVDIDTIRLDVNNIEVDRIIK